jgi:hypothetical protein
MMIRDVQRDKNGIVMRPKWDKQYRISIYQKQKGKRVHRCVVSSVVDIAPALPPLDTIQARLMGRKGETKQNVEMQVVSYSSRVILVIPKENEMRRIRARRGTNAIIMVECVVDQMITWMAGDRHLQPANDVMNKSISMLRMYAVKVEIGILRQLDASDDVRRAYGTSNDDLGAYLAWARAGTTPLSIRIVEEGYLAKRFLEEEG